MKKTCFIVLCIAMGTFTAFGEASVNSTADSEILHGQNEAAQFSQENTTDMPENDLTADGNGSPELLSAGSDSERAPVEADAGVAETEDSPVVDTNTANESYNTKTIISTGEADGETQENKDIVSPIEKNEPTRRTKTKRRPFSLHTGLVIAATGANNLISALDFFKPELVIDLNKIADSMMKSGMHVGALLDFDTFFRFTVLEEHTVKFSITANADVWGNLPKSLFELLAKGNEANAFGETIKGTINAKANVFADMGVMYQLSKPRYSFSARLAYFAPIAYMENPDAKYSLAPHITNGTVDGIIMKAEGTANVYGAVPDYFTSGRKPSIVDILKNGGLDLSLTGMYSPANWVAITGGVNYLPLMPVVTTKGVHASFASEVSMTNLLGKINGGSPSFPTPTVTRDFSSTLPQKKIMRPLKISIGADFKPFKNNYLILSPFLAFPVLNAKPYYVDGGLKIESRFAKVLGVYLDTRYIERIWRHELCFFLDSRWFTFNLAASVASQDFKRTFTTLSGVGVKFGIGIGF